MISININAWFLHANHEYQGHIYQNVWEKFQVSIICQEQPDTKE